MKRLQTWAMSTVTLGVLAAFAQAAPMETLPISQIQPGMVGEGLTVFSSNKIESFKVEILGVLRHYGPKRNLILAKLEGGPLAETGVIAGMSGSPVYIDDKLVGAVAFSFPFSKEPIAGITPIAEMVEATSTQAPRAPAARLSFPLTPEKLEDVVATHRQSIPIQGTSLSGLDLLKPYLGKLLVPIATPASLHGFAPEAFELIAPLLRKVGIEPLMGGAMAPVIQSSTGELSLGNDERPIRPGDSIGVALVTGDMDVNAVGTVTHVDELTKTVYAFGHPFYNLGPIEYPMTRSDVQLVLPSLYNSFKMANTGPIVGTWLQDRTTAVKGVLDKNPRMIPLSVEVNTSRGQSRPFRLRIVNDELFSPVLVYVTLASILQSTERDFGSQTVEVSARIYMDEEPPVIIEDIFADQQPALAASAMVAAPMSFLMANDFEKVQIKEVRVEIDAAESLKTARLVRAWLDKDQVAPGGSVPLKLLMRSYRGEETLETVNVEIPTNVGEGTLQLLIADATTISNYERRLIQARFEPRNLDQLIRALNGLRKNNRLYVRLNEPGTGGAIVAGEYLSSLPPSVMNILQADQSNGSFIPVRTSTLWEYELVTDYSVSGSRVLEITVKNP
jgi:hypothetical protein